MLGYRTCRRMESVGEMTEDYKDSFLHERIRERWGGIRWLVGRLSQRGIMDVCGLSTIQRRLRRSQQLYSAFGTNSM